MAMEYKKEFFDREYTAWEAYSRVWKYARKYKSRIFIGLLSGMLTAGTMLPMLQVIQPALEKVSQNERIEALKSEFGADSGEAVSRSLQPKEGVSVSRSGGDAASPFERELARKSKLPSWYPKAEKVAKKLGIELQDESGAMGGALLLMAVVIIPLVVGCRLLFIFLNQYCLCWAATRAVVDLRIDLFRQVQKQSLQFHGRIDVGQLMSRATGDPAAVQGIIQGMFAELARAPFEILLAVGFILWFAVTNHMLATLGIIAIGLPAFMVPIVGIGKRIRHRSRRTLETIGILLICGFLVWCFATHVTLANVLPMLAPLLLIYKPIKQMCNLQVQIEGVQTALQRIWSLMDLDTSLPENPDAKPKDAFTDGISFNDVTFRYETADHDAVSHATFEIPRGKMVAVVSGTGSGKTTMSGLLARFFDPRSGKVSMDGTNLRELRICDLRRLVGSVQQETILFNDTVEENIKYGSPNATHEQVVDAAKMANAHEFIIAHPEGYARLAGEKGFALWVANASASPSRARSCGPPPILILDEATSALDTVTEKLVQDALVSLMKNRTVFAIAHRLSTIRDADLILVMDHGVIVERGTHDELYAENGVYRKLCDMQATNRHFRTVPESERGQFHDFV